MKTSFWLIIWLFLLPRLSFSQIVPFPEGPRNFNEISPWGYTNAGTNWDTSPYLPFIYRNMWFRLMPPNGVTYDKSSDSWHYDEPGKKYPLILFFQGAGELGDDNNKQLLHGGQRHKNAVLSGEFPGYLLYPQSVYYTDAEVLIEKIIATYPIDINRIYVHGLSNGANWTWHFATRNPTLVAAMAPMSGLAVEAEDPAMLYTPIRQAQGGLDTNPAPNWTQTIVDWYENNGGQMEYFYFPNLGHGTWNSMYNRSDFFSWFLQQKKNKIYVRYNRNELCPEETVNVTMGFTPGFDDYEWEKDGVPMSTHAHAITATDYGSYRGRIKNRGQWSEWSDPVEVKLKPTTITPPIQLANLQSTVVPDINGNSAVSLTLPEGYETYTYFKNGTSVGTARTVTVNGPGTYEARVKEFGGCSSSNSIPLIVIDANGSPKPDLVSNVQATTVSKTQLRITWENNLTPVVNETGFEVYRSLTSSGPYTLVAVTGPDVLQYNDSNLPSNTTFYYRIRPIGSNGAAAPSAPVSAITDVDVTPPTAPGNLTVTSTSPNSIGLSWSASSDDVGVALYDIYVRQHGQTNFVKAYTTAATSQTVFQLSRSTLYNFVVKARDGQGNTSPASAQVVAATIVTGLDYAYYEGNWSVLPNFANETPEKTGTISNFSLTPKLKNDQFGFVWTGIIQIPNSGSYTFYTSSDDGSKLWVNDQLVVNNDGLHGTQEKSGNISLSAGYYPIRAEFFEQGGSEVMQVRWRGPGISKQLIPDSRLREGFNMPAAPSTPSGLARTVIDYKSIRLNWNNYTGTGTDIEIYRSPNGSSSSWTIINTIPKSQNSYVDTTLLPSTRYYYRLRAINSGNVSTFTSSVNGTTSALPPLPAAPTNLQLISLSTKSASIQWSDNSNNESKFEIFKSINDGEFSKVATLPANTTQFTDSSLFAHTKYAFKVLSANVRGGSAFSNELVLTSLNSNPVLSGVTDVTLHFEDEKTIPLTATDPDNDFVVIGGELPEFVQLFDDGEGNGLLTIAPTEADLGEHTGLELYAMDIFGGIHTVYFKITVNTNHSPVISPADPVFVKETNTAVAQLSATDADNDPITWGVAGAPEFVTTTVNGNDIELNFNPDTNHAGNYNIILSATDPGGASGLYVLPVTVENYDPNFNVQINFRTASNYNGPSDWNNIGPEAATTTSLNKTNGSFSGITLVNEDSWEVVNRDVYGITPGLYPNTVSGSYLGFWNGDGAHVLRLLGLNPQGKFNLKFLSSSRVSYEAIGETTFTIAGQSQSTANNNTDLVTFSGLTPTSTGELVISVTGPEGGYGILNAMVIESYYEGNNPPPAPSNLEASFGTDAIQVTWRDNAANENNYELYRSVDNVNFDLLETLPKDAIRYDDSDYVAGNTYYYKVRGTNSKGASAYSNTSSIVAPNTAPVIQPIDPITVSENSMKWVLVTATDRDNDHLTFTLENQPPFMWTEDVANGKMNLAFAPGEGDNGIYEFLVHVDDEENARATATVNLTITGLNETEYRINFTTSSSLAAAPWNNITSLSAGSSLQNIRDNNNSVSAIDLTLQTAWYGTNPNGNNTGNNSGIYPDAVMSNSFYVQDNAPRNILISGLNASRTYDFAFFASRMGAADARNTTYAVGTQSATLNASNNTSNLARVTGIRPNASGQVTITITKSTTSAYGYLNALVIREYIEDETPSAPSAPAALTSQVITRTSIRLTWQDQSSNETGFEVWRSVGNNANYSLVTTVGPGVTTYTNTNLTANTAYYFKVRGVNQIGQSLYSNETSASTFDYSISVNFDAFNGNAAGWNNLSAFMTNGQVVSNLVDEFGTNTGVSMTVVEEFAGDNPFGMVTGNNSGVVPDRVMEGSWWIDRTTRAVLRFDNLSFLKSYNFGFFASRNATGDRTTVYIINDEQVSLNASMNTDNMAQIKNVTPDLDGTITVTVTTTSGALFGYLNGLVIQAVPPTGGAGARVASSLGSHAENMKALDAEGNDRNFAAYPNPFVDKVYVKLGSQPLGKFKVDLVSTTGVVIFTDSFDQTPDLEGIEIKLDKVLSSGVYLLRILSNSGVSQHFRLVKK